MNMFFDGDIKSSVYGGWEMDIIVKETQGCEHDELQERKKERKKRLDMKDNYDTRIWIGGKMKR